MIQEDRQYTQVHADVSIPALTQTVTTTYYNKQSSVLQDKHSDEQLQTQETKSSATITTFKAQQKTELFAAAYNKV